MSHRRLRVYISGPITKGDRIANFAQACEAQTRLMQHGFAPLNPMLTMLHPAAWTIDHDQWIACDLPWVEAADAVLRLPGESTGADTECRHAMECGIPVARCVAALIAWRNDHLTNLHLDSLHRDETPKEATA